MVNLKVYHNLWLKKILIYFFSISFYVLMAQQEQMRSSSIKMQSKPNNHLTEESNIQLEVVNANEEILFTQFPLKNDKAIYKFSYEGGMTSNVLQSFDITGASDKVQLFFELRMDNEGYWRMVARISGDQKSSLTYKTVMDKYANVLREDVSAISYITQYEINTRGKNNRRKGKTILQSTTEHLEILTGKQKFFGESKVLRLSRDKKIVTELMISPEDIITTFCQIAVFAGSIDKIPVMGKKIRWVAEGKPLPVIIQRTGLSEDKKNFVLSVFKCEEEYDYRKNGVQSPKTPLLEFILPVSQNQFIFPQKIILVTSTGKLILQKQ